jgi:F420H(2)-dependent quinone reductase
MRAMKIAVIAVLVYMGIVTLFESSIGYLQPMAGSTLVITTTDKAGVTHDRVVSKLESDGKLYVAANHWPRAWYRRALENPDVQITIDGTKGNYRAVPISGDEHARVESANRLPFFFRVLTGFPPRLFMRLDPRP